MKPECVNYQSLNIITQTINKIWTDSQNYNQLLLSRYQHIKNEIIIAINIMGYLELEFK